MSDNSLILAIKSEFLQTKVGLYDQENLLFLKFISHSQEVLETFKENTDQFQYRAEAILEELRKADLNVSDIKVIIARGGLLKPISSGIYEVNEAMKRDLHHSPVGKHSINIGGLIASYLTLKIVGSKAYIADPPVVDELDEIARYTGLPDIKRKSVFHALNHKYVGRKYARAIHKNYEELNLIVAHLGDGISIGAHKNGRVVDVNQCFDGEGPFSLERSGTIPMVDLVRMCYSGKYTEEQVLTIIRNAGGLYAYQGTSNYYDLEKGGLIDNPVVHKVFEAMAYQVSKYIGYMAPVFRAPVDAILITGMLANHKWFTSLISERVKFIAPIHIFPGEDVIDALASNGQAILKGTAQIQEYQ
ncbi:MAG TPA: butyrate kinase [Bacteroidales bacterium]